MNESRTRGESESRSAGALSRVPGGQLVLHSNQLLNGAKSVLIQHGPELYRLQLTRQGRLILTK